MSTSQRSKLEANDRLTLRSSSNKSRAEPTVASRALALTSYFLSGVFSINLSQFLGTPLYFVNEAWYNTWIAFTKQSFGLLTMGLTEAFAPTTVIVSGDASVRGQIQKLADGRLKLDFPRRLVLIANHQIYTDWLYLWWMAYCSGMHGRLYIVLKESLKKIPIIGWGMQLSQFIFLKRDWEQDKPRLAGALQRLNRAEDPMWLLLFPEGTNLAASTRERSAKWAAKTGIADTKHMLLPRSTGLQFCLEQLRETTDYLYDCTVAYEGVARGQFAQDIFTLKAGYIEGRPPKSVSMYWRRFEIKDIPLQDPRIFDLWLTARWREKDLLIENYLRFGRFPSDVGATKLQSGRTVRGCGRIKVQIKSSHWYEFLQIFAPMGVLAMVLYVFYGALPQKIWRAINKDAIEASSVKVQNPDLVGKSDPRSSSLDSFFDNSRQDKTLQGIGLDVMKHLQSQEVRSLIARAGSVQKWLEDPQRFLTDNISSIGEPQLSSKTFADAVLEEETRRRAAQNTNPHQGTFWKDLEGIEKPAKGIRSNKINAGKALEKKKGQPPKLESRPKVKGAFWQTIRQEEIARKKGVDKAAKIGQPAKRSASVPGGIVGGAKSRGLPS